VKSPPPLCRVQWSKNHRIIPSRYPPVQLFERVGDPKEWEALAEIESMTNDRVRQETGYISLVKPAERVSGPGASSVMAPFTHLGQPSRFSTGAYGVYYCGRRLETAIAETAYHMGRFYAATREPPLDVDMRVLIGKVNARFHDIRGGSRRWKAVYEAGNYVPGQALASVLRAQGSNGIVYDSVRHKGGECLAAFRPKAVGIPIQGSHLTYHWNGTRIGRYFDYSSDKWVTLEITA